MIHIALLSCLDSAIYRWPLSKCRNAPSKIFKNYTFINLYFQRIRPTYETSNDQCVKEIVWNPKLVNVSLKSCPELFVCRNYTCTCSFISSISFQCNSKNIRMVAMNNLLPSTITMHQMYDLKGSTYKRKVSLIHLMYSNLDYNNRKSWGIAGELYSWAGYLRVQAHR